MAEVTEEMVEAAMKVFHGRDIYDNYAETSEWLKEKIAGVRKALTAAENARKAPIVKPLEWIHNEVRSPLGDLYSVVQMSPNVWTTYLNGTAFPGWKTQRSGAIAVAESHYAERSALSTPPQQDDLRKALEDAYIRGATWYRQNEDFGGLLRKAAQDYADYQTSPDRALAGGE